MRKLEIQRSAIEISARLHRESPEVLGIFTTNPTNLY